MVARAVHQLLSRAWDHSLTRAVTGVFMRAVLGFLWRGARAEVRARLERVCRYALRPPIAHDRFQWTADGDVLLALRHRPSTMLRPP